MIEAGQSALKVSELDITAINTTLGLAILSDNTSVPITHYIDNNGDECTRDRAAAFVAGADDVGWFTALLSDYRPATVH